MKTRTLKYEEVSDFRKGIAFILIVIGLIIFVVGYKHYSVDYMGAILQFEFSINMFIEMIDEFSNDLGLFLSNKWEILMSQYTVSLDMVFDFIANFGNIITSLCLYTGGYIVLNGSMFRRIKILAQISGLILSVFGTGSALLYYNIL